MLLKSLRRMTGTLYEDLQTFMISLSLIVRMFPTEVVEKIKIHTLSNNCFPKLVPFMR